MKKPKIACIGEGLIALVPEQGGPLEDSERFDRRVGGAELNVAMAARSLGVESAWLSRIGNDGFGRHILHSARGRGVDVSAVEIDPSRSTGIYVKERGGSSGTEHDFGCRREPHALLQKWVRSQRTVDEVSRARRHTSGPEFLDHHPHVGHHTGAFARLCPACRKAAHCVSSPDECRCELAGITLEST